MTQSISKATTLDVQIDNMNKVVSQKLHGYKRNSHIDPIDAVSKIIEKHSRTSISREEKEKVYTVIKEAISSSRRIPIGFTWGCSGMAPSTMKISESLNYPRKGDLWCLWWFDILNRKIKLYYEPGIDLIIGDEVPHFHTLGWTYNDVIRKHEIMKNLAEQHFDFIKIVAIPDYSLDAESIHYTKPSVEEVFAIATSLPTDKIPKDVFDALHGRRQGKNWSWIKKQIPTRIWDEAEYIITKAALIGELRKQKGFFDQLFETSMFIDASITEKGRFNPRPWYQTSPQHGGTILTSDLNSGKYSMIITPEYRIIEHRNEYIAFTINTLDFKYFTERPITEQNYIFYWQHN